MAYKSKLIENPKNGQTIKFIQTARDTDGRLLEMESSFAAFSKEPPPHYHPNQVEDFVVLSGELSVRREGKVIVYKTGDSFHIPVNEVHSMWNCSSEKTLVNWKVRPALNSEYFFETVTGLARDGETNDAGIPNFFQLVLLANKYSNVFRASKPPFYVQKILFGLLTPLAYTLGYRSSYKKYID